MMPIYDNSRELIVCRYRNGIILLRPEDPKLTSPFIKPIGFNVDDILSKPFCTYFSDVNTRNFHINDITVAACGFDSPKSAQDKTLYKVMYRKSVERIILSNELAMKSHTQQIEEYVSRRKDDIEVPTLSIKSPWYDEDDKVIGVFGCTAVLGQQPLAEMLSTIANLGIIANNNSFENAYGGEIDSVYFTKRELDCIQLTLQGKSAKQVGVQLRVSQRTVEHHLDNIKVKMNVRSKSEMIVKLMNMFH